MKRAVLLFSFAICIAASALTNTEAVYTKTLPAIYGTITAQNNGCSHYPFWDAQKELRHEYKINAVVQYGGKLYQRKNSGTSQNAETPDNNKSWVEIQCDKCAM